MILEALNEHWLNEDQYLSKPFIIGTNMRFWRKTQVLSHQGRSSVQTFFNSWKILTTFVKYCYKKNNLQDIIYFNENNDHIEFSVLFFVFATPTPFLAYCFCIDSFSCIVASILFSFVLLTFGTSLLLSQCNSQEC